ncbi:MAG: hypothetical protein U0M02_06940 [Acutalibacteraceae bacterium]|nr:hypothetical protein [Acutalibacteraceae bacterium]
MAKYAIWNKKDYILTPIGEVLTAEQWIERYPIAGIETITVVCAAGEINGAFFGTLGAMVNRYESEGCDFSAYVTAEEKLAAIEAFEDAREAEARAKAEAQAEAEAQNAELNASSLASIAASMEYQNMLTLEDTEV